MLAFDEWLILMLTCLAGAASPGPSVVVLIRSVVSPAPAFWLASCLAYLTGWVF